MSLIMYLLHLLSTTPPHSSLLTGQPHLSQPNQTDQSSIDRAYRYLYAHFREIVPLSKLAAYAGQNPSALCRSFKRSSGCSIGQFCTQFKLVMQMSPKAYRDRSMPR